MELATATIPPLPDGTAGRAYRQLPDWPAYTISDDGRVWSCRKIGPFTGFIDWHELRQGTTAHGYRRVRLSKGGRSKLFQVHRLVLLAFVGEPPPGCEACHADGDKLNNRLSNLRWDTPKANSADRESHGRTAHGEAKVGAKLTAEEVVFIRTNYRKGSSTHGTTALAARFGVANQTIHRIVNDRIWRRPGDGLK